MIQLMEICYANYNVSLLLVWSPWKLYYMYLIVLPVLTTSVLVKNTSLINFPCFLYMYFHNALKRPIPTTVSLCCCCCCCCCFLSWLLTRCLINYNKFVTKPIIINALVCVSLAAYSQID